MTMFLINDEAVRFATEQLCEHIDLSPVEDVTIPQVKAILSEEFNLTGSDADAVIKLAIREKYLVEVDMDDCADANLFATRYMTTI